jgi:hypothetical protein
MACRSADGSPAAARESRPGGGRSDPVAPERGALCCEGKPRSCEHPAGEALGLRAWGAEANRCTNVTAPKRASAGAPGCVRLEYSLHRLQEKAIRKSGNYAHSRHNEPAQNPVLRSHTQGICGDLVQRMAGQDHCPARPPVLGASPTSPSAAEPPVG